MAARSISERKQIRYLLGLSSPAEREHIESEYFEDEDAFQEMLTAEDDLIDAYARGELADDERRRFEKNFVSSLRGRKRVQFARAFASTVDATRPVETKLARTSLDIFKTFQSPRLLRTATIAAMIFFLAVLAWLIIDRRRMNDELRELRAESQRAPHSPEVKNDREKIASSTPKPAEHLLNPPDASLSNSVMPRETSTSDGTTTVRGTVKDPNGNVVSGATVTLTFPARNFTRTQSTNEDGAYVFNAIPPGTYSLEVNASGFKRASTSRLAALVDTPSVRDVQLELGAVSETVDITSAAEAPINTNDASLGNSFERRRITELPLNANNVVGLLSLQPDVSRTRYVNGGRADQSSIRLDGVDATIRIPSSRSWIRFQLALETATIHEDYRVTIQTADGRPVTSVDWTEPFTPNQTMIDTPVISTGDLPSGDYVFLLMGKDAEGSFVKVAAYSFKVIKY